MGNSCGHSESAPAAPPCPLPQMSRSITMAMPWPPPTHIVSSPKCSSWNCSESISVVVIRAPVMPNGFPTAIAAVDVELVDVDAEVAVGRDHLCGERLVDLDQVDVVDRHPGQGERPPGGLHRAVPHDLRRERRDAGRDDPGERCEAEFAGPGVGHDDDS